MSNAFLKNVYQQSRRITLTVIIRLELHLHRITCSFMHAQMHTRLTAVGALILSSSFMINYHISWHS